MQRERQSKRMKSAAWIREKPIGYRYDHAKTSPCDKEGFAIFSAPLKVENLRITVPCT
jgi:hypothetical protein